MFMCLLPGSACAAHKSREWAGYPDLPWLQLARGGIDVPVTLQGVVHIHTDAP